MSSLCSTLWKNGVSLIRRAIDGANSADGPLEFLAIPSGEQLRSRRAGLDPRLKAALDMDGMVAAESATEGAKKPVLFMMEESLVAPDVSLEGISEQRRRTVEFNRAQEKFNEGFFGSVWGYWLVVDGTTHKNFSDSPLFSPLKS